MKMRKRKHLRYTQGIKIPCFVVFDIESSDYNWFAFW